MENLRVCFVENDVSWYEREEYGCFEYMSCLARRITDCRRKHLTTDPEVVAYVQGLRISFSEESVRGASSSRPASVPVFARVA